MLKYYYSNHHNQEYNDYIVLCLGTKHLIDLMFDSHTNSIYIMNSMLSQDFIHTYTRRFENEDHIMLGDIGAIEKLSLESELRDTGMSKVTCVTMAGIWSNVVHLNCRYTPIVYLQFRDALRVLPEGSFRDSIRARFLVALGLKDFPSLKSS